MKVRHGKKSLRVMLTIPFVMLTILSVGVVGVVSFYNGRQAVNEVTSQLQREISTRIQDRLRSFLEVPRQIVRVNADTISRGLPPADDAEALQHSFREQVRIFDSVTSIYFGNTRGGLANSGREPDTDQRYVMSTEGFADGLLEKYAVDARGNRTVHLASVPNFDARIRPWYIQAVENGSAAWSSIYILSTGQDMAIACSHSVYDARHTLLGVVSSDVFLSHISRFLQSVKIGDEGQCFIFERSGLLIASSTGKKPFTEGSEPGQYRRIHVGESSSSVIRAAVGALNRRFEDYRTVDEVRDVPFEMDGKRHFLEVSSFKDAGGLDWLIGVVASESDFMSKVDANNRDTILLIAVALLVTIFFGLYVARRVTRPVLRLHASALCMAKGEWPPAMDVDSSIDEIDGLTKSFDHMAAELRQTMESLSHEVAERTRTEAALRESEEHYRLLFNSIRDAVFVYLLDEEGRPGRFIQVNDEACRKLGYSRDELFNMTPSDIGAPERVDLQSGISQELETNDSALFESVHVAKDGQRISVESNVHRLTIGEQSVVLSISRDITERKRAEGALKEAHRRLDTIIESFPDATMVIDPDGRVTHWNRAIEEMTGVSKAAILHKGAYEYALAFYGSRRPILIDLAMSMATGNGLEMREYDNFQRDGDRFLAEVFVPQTFKGKGAYLSATASILRDNSGNVTGAIECIRDITEHKKAEVERMQLERQLLQSQKAESLGRMAGAIAHNFNNMLSAVLGNLELVLDDLPEGSEAHLGVSEAMKASWRAAEISRFMLTYVGQTTGKKEPLDLAESVEEARVLLSASIPENVHLKVGLPERGPMIEADRVHIKQILTNLVYNAMESIGETEGHITLTVEVVAAEKIRISKFFPMDWNPKEKHYACLSVSDTGPGLDTTVVESIFDPFFTTRFTGRGLGLPVVLGLTRSQEGAIAVESKPGEGAVFRVYLPMREEEWPPPGETPNANPFVKGGGLALVVDDEAVMRDLAVSMLKRKLDFEVLTACDGFEALEIFGVHKEEIDLVLLDLSMPGMNGSETMAALRSLRPDIPVILTSGYDEVQVRQSGSAERPQAFLHKPYKVDDLKRVVAICQARQWMDEG